MARNIDFSTLETEPAVTASMNKRNIMILENIDRNEITGDWSLKFSFDYKLEKGITVCLSNCQYDSTGNTWSLGIEKCGYLGILKNEHRVSFDVVGELVNIAEIQRLQQSTDEKLRGYLDSNVVPLVTQKIKYTKYKPQFCFFLSHKSKDKPLMRTYRDGLAFLGYKTWLDESNMPYTNLSMALKIAIENCDCLIAWLNKDYFDSVYCKPELLYAKKLGKIIIPFGVFGEIKDHLGKDEGLKFLEDHFIDNPHEKSFFEVLRRIDETLFNFEMIAFPSATE